VPPITSQRGFGPGRHHVGIQGAIKSECLGVFIGIGNMAYRSFREVLAGSTPASIRRPQSNVVTQMRNRTFVLSRTPTPMMANLQTPLPIASMKCP
jgi:hypothetical protein